ncbi:MAG: hypothetical protein QGG40_15100, partial [Myxococcota bacterium]|nr:hypothetical protein [Myxococcota bacterium]
ALSGLAAETFPDQAILPGDASRITLHLESTTNVISMGVDETGRQLATGPLQADPVVIGDDMSVWLEKGAPDFWEQRLLPLWSQEASSIEVQLGTRTLSAERGPDGWDDERVFDLLQELGDLRVDRSPVETPGTRSDARLLLRSLDGEEQGLALWTQEEEGPLARSLSGGAPFNAAAGLVEALAELWPSESAHPATPDGPP